MPAMILLSRAAGLLALSGVKRQASVLLALLPILGCSDRVELLSSQESLDSSDGPATGGTAGRGGSSGEGSGGTAGGARDDGGIDAATGGTGGTGAGWQICAEALASGQQGDRCSFADVCTERGRCSYRQAVCRGGQLQLASGRDPTCQMPCTLDRECLFGSEWCESGVCVPCVREPIDACPHGWARAVFPRNGCSIAACAPPTECRTSADCSGAVCYAGRTCSPDCAPGDPSCCEGNFCSRRGCDVSTARLSCEQIGCPLGQRCGGGDWQRPACVCDGSAWQCSPPEPFFVCQ